MLLRTVLVGAVLSSGAVGAAAHPGSGIVAEAPHEIVASGLPAPSGVAVASDGTIYFTDEVKGIFRIRPGGGPVLLSEGAERPGALLLEDNGRLLLLAKRLRRGYGDASRNGLLLRFDVVSKQFSILADGLRRPRGLARAAAGGILVTADGLRPDAERDDEDDRNDDDGDDPPFAGGVFRWTLGSGFQAVLRGFKRPAGIAVEDSGSLLVAAERYGDRLGSLFRVAGETVSVVYAKPLRRPTGVALDATGAVFLAGRRQHAGSRSGVIVKLVEGRPAVDFATRLERPRYLAFAAQGGLLATDAGADRLVRFLAPPAPSVEAPSGQDPVLLRGTAPLGSEVLALGGRSPVRVLASGNGAFEMSVPVAPDARELSLFAIGSGGRGLASVPTRLTINRDNVPPQITFSVEPPPNAAGWNRTDVTVTFTCSDAGSGVASCPGPVTVTAEGAGQVVAGTATDHAGNSTSVSVTLNVDKTPPTLSGAVSPPPNVAGWNNTDVTVSFEAQDALSGVAALSAPVPVTTEGAGQLVSGSASDRAGNAASATLSVSLDKTAPVVGLGEPTEGLIRRLPRVHVAGTALDANEIVAIDVNGVDAGTSGHFSAEVPLQQGPQPVTATARDVAGNATAVSVSVAYRPLPVVKITSPANLSAFGSSPITVSGSVDDPQATVHVGLEQVPAAVSGGAFAATGVHLQEGGNVVTAVATNAAGDAASDSVTLILDTVAPRVLIDSPPNGSVTTEAAITVTGRVNDVVIGTVNSGQAQVTVNGVTALVSNRTFQAGGIALAPGMNTVTATVRDAVGNQDTKTITLLRETVPGARIAVLSGNNQAAGIGEDLPEPLVVGVSDEQGQPLAGRTVIFRVGANNGLLRDDQGQEGRGLSLATDSQGQARVRYVLGTRSGAGNNRVDATTPGVPGAAVFLASGLSHPAAKINVDSGGLQKGVVEQPLPRPFVAVVTDEGHNRLANVPVTFSVEEGDGNFSGEASVTVNTDSDGRALAVLTLGAEPGIENNLVSATVESLVGFPAVFAASALEPGDPAATRISGVVLDNSNVPVPGVTLRLEDTAISAASDAQGQFTLTGVPVGDVHLVVDGSTAQRPGTWPNLEFQMVTVAGAENTLGMPIYLLPLDLAHGIFVDETHGGTLTLPDYPGFSLNVAPNSAMFPDGTRHGTITVTVVHTDKVPMVPNFGQQPRFIVTIQPPGVRFDPPAAVTHPNVDGLAPGEVTELYSFDHDMESFVATGTATVSEDGTVLRSDPGTGILKGGWHCGGNPQRPGGVCCGPCQKCENGKCKSNGQKGNSCEDPKFNPTTFTPKPGCTVTLDVDASCWGKCDGKGKCKTQSDRWGLWKLRGSFFDVLKNIFQDSCLGPDTKQRLQDALCGQSYTITCNPGKNPGGTCARTPGPCGRTTPVYSMELTSNTTKVCGDVRRSILHELMHGPPVDLGQTGLDCGHQPCPQDRIWGCAASCYPLTGGQKCNFNGTSGTVNPGNCI